jgi:tRNA threonylcarbamoyladenosine biosynthesis protein TsaE
MQFFLEDLNDYIQLAQTIINSQVPLVILSGPLGVGKTTLTQKIATLLGSQASVSSPTYTLIHEYPTLQGILVHIDAYRLPSAEALFELGLEDYLERAKLVIVEWGEGLLNYFPDALLVKLEFAGDSRIATIVL